MIKNYFKTAWRGIFRNKVFSLLNMLGLGLGMGVALMIGLWVYHESSYDRFLPEYEQLYQVKRNFNSNGDTLTFQSTSLKLADALRNQIPEFEFVSESAGPGNHLLSVQEKKLIMRGGIFQKDFLKMFKFPLLQGRKEAVLEDPFSIVLTESAAKALFGNQNPVNQTLKFDNHQNLKVTGILKDIPTNSSLQFSFIVPFSYLEQADTNVKAARSAGYGANSYRIYARLKPTASYQQVEQKIRDIEHTEKDNSNAMLSEVIMQPLKDWHLYSEYENGKATGGYIDYVRLFTIIGILVLVIACINFINLSTARSEKRAKEVGIRKAIGSSRYDLLFQFMIESLLLTAIAFLLSLILVSVALPGFNALTGAHISIPSSSPMFWTLAVAGVIITALAAGSRPAFILSAFNPVKALKSGLGRAAALPRKILVVLQFCCSVALIISAFVVYQQIQYARNRPTGYDANRLIMTSVNAELDRNYQPLKNELIRQGIASTVTQASSPSTDIYWHSDVDNWPGKKAGETIEMASIIVAEDYFKTVGMKILEGRDFASKYDSTSVVLNQTAIRQMRITDPLGKLITWQGLRLKIVGVAQDAIMASPYAAAEPTLFWVNQSPGEVMIFRLSSRISTVDAVSALNGLFNRFNPSYPFDYRFVDQSYEEKFKLEMLVGKLAGLFASLAVCISCLGLFGLASYVAERRTKEIGVRKVLGASAARIWLLLSGQFVLLVLIGCLLASPLAYYFLHQWLQQYPYHVPLGASVFVWSCILAVLITLATVSFQCIRASLANPVKSLRTE